MRYEIVGKLDVGQDTIVLNTTDKVVLVTVNGLVAVEGTDYNIVDNKIVLAEPVAKPFFPSMGIDNKCEIGVLFE